MAFAQSLVKTGQDRGPNFHGLEYRDETSPDQSPSEQHRNPQCQEALDAWARHANASNGFGDFPFGCEQPL